MDFDSEVKIERFVSKILDKMGALHSHENQNHGHGKCFAYLEKEISLI